MIRFTAFIALLLFNFTLLAQNDTVSTEQTTLVEIYDVVAVYKTITDGRGRQREFTSEMKGEILNYDSSTGVLTFKDTDGRMYSFASNEYKYFEYDKEFTVKNKPFVLHTRKENEFEISAGFRTTFININDNFTSDDYFLYSGGGATDLPIALYFGAGKYFNRKHFAGVEAEIAITSYGKNYFSGGFRYLYQYDAYKKNVALYVPLELNFFTSRYDQFYQVNDSVVETTPSGTITYYPKDENVEFNLSAVSLSLGHGFSFILNNKNSIAVELALIKYFPVSTTFTGNLPRTPNVSMTGSGLKLSLMYNLF